MTDTEPEDKGAEETDAAAPEADPFGGGQIQYGDMSAHMAFQQQLAELLSHADITEEERQQFLIAATCPCCGAGGLSFSLKLKPGSTPRF